MKHSVTQGSLRDVKIIAGLGNPGTRYATTYHNVGLLALDYLAHALGGLKFQPVREEPFAYAKRDSLVLVKPNLPMNESGRAVALALKFFRLKPRELLVIHDDSDILLNNIKFSFGRGPAGHRGVTSLITHLKTKNFWRARIGIRKTRGKAGEFVLRKISHSDLRAFHSVVSELTRKFSENDDV